jgi:hypothetical protein
MKRRSFLQLLAGGIVGTAAVLHAPGWVLSSTKPGRRLACEYLRGQYLAFVQAHQKPPYRIEVCRDLFEALEHELVANERFIERLPTLRAKYEAMLPEHLMFKAARVLPTGSGWDVVMTGEI